MASFELHGRSCSTNDAVLKPSFSRMSTRSTFSRSSPSQELPRLDAMSVASCPTTSGASATGRGPRDLTRRQVMSADGAPLHVLERQNTSFHTSSHMDSLYGHDRPYTRQEYKPAMATLPKRGLIKLTALDYELKNPELFRQKTNVGSFQAPGATSGKPSTKHKSATKKSSARQLGHVKGNQKQNADIPTFWGEIQRECTTVGELKKSILEFSGDHVTQRPVLHSYHTTLGSWEPSKSIVIPGKSNDNADQPT